MERPAAMVPVNFVVERRRPVEPSPRDAPVPVEPEPSLPLRFAPDVHRRPPREIADVRVRALRLEGPQLLLERLHPAQVGGGLKRT